VANPFDVLCDLRMKTASAEVDMSNIDRYDIHIDSKQESEEKGWMRPEYSIMSFISVLMSIVLQCLAN
jgi:hypothetical protein